MALLRLEKINCEYEGTYIISDGKITVPDGSLAIVCGRTGSGKSTLLKYIYENTCDRAGYVMQDPESQIVCDTVYEELSMAPCGCGMSDDETRRAVAEASGYFGISSLIDRHTDELSGGEKQIVNIASVMTVKPEILILDEPSAMLDPVMTKKITDCILRLRREFGITVIIAEHNTDELWSEADSVILVKDGKIYQDTPEKMTELMSKDNSVYEIMPSYARIFPVTKTGHTVMNLLQARKEALHEEVKAVPEKTGKSTQNEVFLEFRNVSFAYEKDSRKILDDMNLKVKRGEIVSLLGENGSGKTTVAKLAAGLLKPYSGSVYLNGKKIKGECTKAGMLFQDVTCHFLEDKLSGRFEGRHPYDLSRGQMQLAALDIVMSKKPELLILDEPGRGLDGYEKKELKEKLKNLASEGITLLMVTHDVDFASEISDTLALLFAGNVSACGDTEKFISESMFYTTAAFRIWGPEKGVFTETQARNIKI